MESVQCPPPSMFFKSKLRKRGILQMGLTKSHLTLLHGSFQCLWMIYKRLTSLSFIFISKLASSYLSSVILNKTNELRKRRRDRVMAIKNLLVLAVLLSVIGVSVANPKGLDLNYYKHRCPDAEAIVRRTTVQYVSRQTSLAAALLRMHFHDCFVRVSLLHFSAF